MSRSTVSRVLTGSPLVSEEARKSVEKAIEDLNYVPSRAARLLASQKAGVIVLVIPEDVSHVFSEPFFAPVIAGIDEELEDTDFILTLFVASGASRRKAERYLLSGSADGALVLSHHLSDQFVSGLVDSIPTVFGGRPPESDGHLYYVDSDNVQGGYLAGRYLLNAGHRAIAVITGDMDMPASADRLEGFTKALLEANVEPESIREGNSTRQGGHEAMVAVLENSKPSAVFVAGDLMARGAIECVIERGLQIPEDIAIVGFDDAIAATNEHPRLTTIHQPLYEYGRAMAKMLLDVLESGETKTPVVLPTHVVARDTA